MTLVKWNPNRHFLTGVDRMLDDFFNDGWNVPAVTQNTHWHPAVDIRETDDAFTIIADLPGLKKKDVNVNVKDGKLEISGERIFENKEENGSYHRRERSYGSFNRSFHLPETILEDKITATFKDGILSVEVPKAEEVKPKGYEIKIS
jgi:HSP20 family protein